MNQAHPLDPPGTLSTVRVAGLEIHNVTQREAVEHIIDRASAGLGGWVVTPNADIAQYCHRDASLKALVNSSDLRVADGMPLIWASRLRGTPLKERVCGSDLVWAVAEKAQEKGLSLFLLGGGQEDTAQRAAETLRTKFPALRIAGTWFPPFGFENDSNELRCLRNALKQADPDITYVALGFPKAERLIQELRADHARTWWLGIGISLSFIDGEIKRAPKWMQVAGLEWLHRLSQEPGRLAKRYLWHDAPYVLALLTSSLWHRLRMPKRTQS